MTTARDRFAQFIDDHTLSQRSVSEKLGCSQGLVSKIRLGQRSPGLDIAFRIERLTRDWEHGPILASEWVTEAPQLSATGTEG